MNNMIIHPSKTKELTVTGARSRTTLIQPVPHRRGRKPKVWRRSGFRESFLIRYSLCRPRLSCAFSTFALRLLRNHSLRSDKLYIVERATTIPSILYVTPPWWGFGGEGNRQRLRRLITRLRRMNYFLLDLPSVDTLAEEADRNQFHMSNSYPTALSYWQVYLFALPPC